MMEFKKGDLVVIDSERNPDWNGAAVVVDVLPDGMYKPSIHVRPEARMGAVGAFPANEVLLRHRPAASRPPRSGSIAAMHSEQEDLPKFVAESSVTSLRNVLYGLDEDVEDLQRLAAQNAEQHTKLHKRIENRKTHLKKHDDQIANMHKRGETQRKFLNDLEADLADVKGQLTASLHNQETQAERIRNLERVEARHAGMFMAVGERLQQIEQWSNSLRKVLFPNAS
jgi:hypothetical protein